MFIGVLHHVVLGALYLMHGSCLMSHVHSWRQEPHGERRYVLRAKDATLRCRCGFMAQCSIQCSIQRSIQRSIQPSIQPLIAEKGPGSAAHTRLRNWHPPRGSSRGRPRDRRNSFRAGEDSGKSQVSSSPFVAVEVQVQVCCRNASVPQKVVVHFEMRRREKRR